MGLKELYDRWLGQGGHQASGNAKTVGQAATDFLNNTYAKGFTVNKTAEESDFDLDKVAAGAVPSTRLAGRGFTEAKTYSNSVDKE